MFQIQERPRKLVEAELSKKVAECEKCAYEGENGISHVKSRNKSFPGEDVNLAGANKKARKCIESFSDKMEILNFDDENSITKNNGIFVEQQGQQEQQRDQERHTELESFAKKFNANAGFVAADSVQMQTPKVTTSAFETTSSWDAQPIGENIRESQLIDSVTISDSNKRKYDLAKYVFQEKFDSKFSGTKNFLTTLSPDFKDSVFYKHQKNADSLLISLNERKLRNIECHFPSKNDGKNVQSMTENNQLTNFHLCSIEGTSETGNNRILTELDGLQKFKKQAIRMAQFLNANILAGCQQ
ncbi:MAG: hypothetical protein LBB18_00840 [Puniceicoccales bacterium]|nr:hypothetical protein [Puniceicoccales bacterium]